LIAKDSHRESMRLEGQHKKTITGPLPHNQLARRQRRAEETECAAVLIWLEKGMTWLAPHAGHVGRPAVFSDASISSV
jgi:hypothetical protein